MKVLALNSSPRTGVESKTELMLTHLVNGMREAGAEVEIVNLRDKKINPCVGCFTCWTKTPGKCIHQDDMARELLPKWLKADLAIYASPLYVFTVNAAMKAFIDRILPAALPFLEQYGDETYHPLRQEIPKAVVLSVAGFPEESIFAPLSSWVNFFFRHLLAAEIYRGSSESLTGPFFAPRIREILEATTRGGRELVTAGSISRETMTCIRQPITDDKKSLRAAGNLFFKTCIAEGMTPREFREKGIMPRPDSLDEFMAIMSLAFNPENAGDAKMVVQYDFIGKVEGSCSFRIADGKIRADNGPAEKPDLAIRTPFSLWMDIMAGKVDPQQAFMQQKYTAIGDFSLLLRMKDFFGM
jgi:multimeric flavodoxin WrbA